MEHPGAITLDLRLLFTRMRRIERELQAADADDGETFECPLLMWDLCAFDDLYEAEPEHADADLFERILRPYGNRLESMATLFLQDDFAAFNRMGNAECLVAGSVADWIRIVDLLADVPAAYDFFTEPLDLIDRIEHGLRDCLIELGEPIARERTLQR